MDTADHLSVLEAGAATLLDAAKGSLDRPVSGCPRWTVDDLVVHIGQVWGWAADIVASGNRVERGRPPEDRSEARLIEWARGNADRLLDTLRAADPDADCWTFGAPRTKRFWIRRQALETALHAWDAGNAAGLPSSIDSEVAADGLDELLMVMVRRSVRSAGWTGQSFHFHRTDGDGEWVVVLGPGDAVDAQRAHAKAHVALRGPSENLWLWSSSRAPLDKLDIEVLGDRASADRWTNTVRF